MAKLLLIEDDDQLGRALESLLETEGFDVERLTDGEEGLYWLRQGTYALAIVDWQLPRLSGVDICLRYRHSGGTSKLLMLTGKDKSNDIVTGLASGADDYLKKPFDSDELVARVHALARRSGSYKSDLLELGLIKLDCARRLCWVNGMTLVLPRREFAILEVLMQNPEHIFSAQSLIDRAWPTGTETSPEAVRVHMTRLRQRLTTASTEAGKYIQNLYGAGYKLELPLPSAETRVQSA